MRLYHTKLMPLTDVIAKFTAGPARLLRLRGKGHLGVGADGDLTIIDPEREWIYEVKDSASKSRNSPFDGWRLKGKAKATIVCGKIAWEDGEDRAEPLAGVATESR